MLIRKLKKNQIYRFKDWNGIKSLENDSYWEFNNKSDSGRDVLIQYKVAKYEIIQGEEYPLYFIFKMISINRPESYIKLWPFEVGLYVLSTGADVEIWKLNDLYRL
jgi:hypothetical protein